MIVSANIAICTPAEPITAGPSVRKKTPHVLVHRDGARPGQAPGRFAAAITSSSSSTPAAATPQAAAWPAVGNSQ